MRFRHPPSNGAPFSSVRALSAIDVPALVFQFFPASRSALRIRCTDIVAGQYCREGDPLVCCVVELKLRQGSFTLNDDLKCSQLQRLCAELEALLENSEDADTAIIEGDGEVLRLEFLHGIEGLSLKGRLAFPHPYWDTGDVARVPATTEFCAAIDESSARQALADLRRIVAYLASVSRG